MLRVSLHGEYAHAERDTPDGARHAPSTDDLAWTDFQDGIDLIGPVSLPLIGSVR